LYFYRARYYSPTVQRFIAQDPIGFGGGTTNLYLYAIDSPTQWSDPLGTLVLLHTRGAMGVGSDPFQHSALVLIPDNPADFAYDPLFGRGYASVGGSAFASLDSPTGLMLSKAFNLPLDNPCPGNPILTPVATPPNMTDTDL